MSEEGGQDAEVERLRRELAVTREQLMRAEKLAALGLLVAGVAHEIHTPLGALRSMHDTGVRALAKLRLVLERSCPDYAAQPGVAPLLSVLDDAHRVVGDASQRVVEIVRRLRSFARPGNLELERVDLAARADDALDLMHHELKQDVVVRRVFGPCSPVWCYPGPINQVLLNLLMNARQAIPERGEIEVRTWEEPGFACLSVRDTGTGIHPDHLEQVFEPGFTTKAESAGTGLGLFIAASIVAEHEGQLSVVSTLGEGTTFELRLPLGDDGSAETVPAAPASEGHPIPGNHPSSAKR